MHVEEEDDDDEPPKSLIKIPKRYVVMLMILIASPISYGSRSLIAETEEYFSEKIDTHDHHSEHSAVQCIHLTENEETRIKLNFTKIVKWHEDVYNSMSYYYYGAYVFGQILGGILSDSYNAKQTLAIGFFSSCLINLFTPIYLKITQGNHLAIRIIVAIWGFAQGTFYPASITLLAHWAPVQERAFMTSIAMAGFYVGVIIVDLTVSWIVEATEDWGSPFYIFGGLGIGITLLWEYLVYSYPNTHPRIDEDEKLYLEIEMHGLIDQKRKSIPYWLILQSINFWAYLVVAVGSSWIWTLLDLSIVDYMTVILKYTKRESKMIICIPKLCLIISLGMFGFLSDWLMRRHLIDRLTLRKTFACMGLMGPPIYMITGSYAGCNRTATIIMFMISLTLLGFVYLGVFLIPMDIAPNYAGFLAAISNVVAIVSRILQMRLHHYLIPNHTIQEFRSTFLSGLMVAVFSNIIFVIFGNSRLQKWNQQTKKRK